MQRESQMVDLENAESVVTELRMGAGELNVSGGSTATPASPSKSTFKAALVR